MKPIRFQLLIILQIVVKGDEIVTSDDEDYDVTGGSGDDEPWIHVTPVSDTDKNVSVL